MTVNFSDPRAQALVDWLRHDLGRVPDDLRLASSDASFRRYFRAVFGNDSLIVMDAPPAHEDVRPFLKVAALLRAAGMSTPWVHAADTMRGFLLLDDFGHINYLDALTVDNADALYGDALDALSRMQARVPLDEAGLPPYDARLLRQEMELFRDWFLIRLMGLELSPAEQGLLDRVWQSLIDSALEQPRVCVHRDYHARNLMVTPNGNPGVLDFQDAVAGPITYDLVSLLRDCYIAWPDARVRSWAVDYYARLGELGLARGVSVERFLRWFDLMGVQRHLKAIGIFSRLKLRDAKPGYIRDIPRTLEYVLRVTADYAELAELRAFLMQRVMESLHVRLRLAA